MIFYFAGAYERQAELRGYRDRLTSTTAHKVNSRWLDSRKDGFTPLDLNGDPEGCWPDAVRDISDLAGADSIVSFTGSGGRGGRHVEHGMAMMLRDFYNAHYRMIVVGPREVIFHTDPGTEVYGDFQAFLAHEIEALR